MTTPSGEAIDLGAELRLTIEPARERLDLDGIGYRYLGPPTPSLWIVAGRFLNEPGDLRTHPRVAFTEPRVGEGWLRTIRFDMGEIQVGTHVVQVYQSERGHTLPLDEAWKMESMLRSQGIPLWSWHRVGLRVPTMAPCWDYEAAYEVFDGGGP